MKPVRKFACLLLSLSFGAVVVVSAGGDERVPFGSDSSVEAAALDESPSFIGLVPARLLETRSGALYKTIDGEQQGGDPLGPRQVLDVQITGRGGVPATGVDTVVVNVTGVNTSTDTYVTVFPTGTTRPDTSNLNLRPDGPTPNLVITKVGENGQISLYNHDGSTDLIVDVMGWIPSISCTETVLAESVVSHAECKALMALYDSTDGPYWSRKTGWDTWSDPCTWHGITCSGSGISGLKLSHNWLKGRIPDDIGNLGNLTNLNLSKNKLDGRIPHDIGNLTNLTKLNLSKNRLDGRIPRDIGNLTNLTNLNLSKNKLKGQIPRKIGNLTNLTDLSLYGNRCLYTDSTSLSSWLRGYDRNWDDGCV